MARKIIYAKSARCPCGAQMAYFEGDDFWDCSAILLGKAKQGVAGVKHEDRLPFRFWKIKPASSPTPYRRGRRLPRWLAPLVLGPLTLLAALIAVPFIAVRGWDGDKDRPTLTPSIRSSKGRIRTGPRFGAGTGGCGNGVLETA